MRLLVAVALCLITVCLSGCHRSSETTKAPNAYRKCKLMGSCTNCNRKQVAELYDEYHVVVFGYNKPSGLLRPAQTHTFATWVKTRNHEIVEQVDISWCPRDGGIRVAASEVPGINKCLAETLQDAQKCRLSYWVLRTDKTFFDAAVRQRDSLRLYKFLDGKSRPQAVNCIHACSDVAGYLDTGASSGTAAGKAVVEHYKKTGRAWSCQDDWVVPLLCQTNHVSLR